MAWNMPQFLEIHIIKKDTPCAAIRLHKEYLQYNDRTTPHPKQVSGVFYQRSMEQLLPDPDADAGADD